MTAKNKIRGNANEVRAVKAFTDAGIKAKRFWGSDGRSGGYHQEVDILISYMALEYITESITKPGKIKIQAKKKKKLPDWLGFSEHVDAVIVSEDHGKQYIMFELKDFIERFMRHDFG